MPTTTYSLPDQPRVYCLKRYEPKATDWSCVIFWSIAIPVVLGWTGLTIYGFLHLIGVAR